LWALEYCNNEENYINGIVARTVVKSKRARELIALKNPSVRKANLLYEFAYIQAEKVVDNVIPQHKEKILDVMRELEVPQPHDFIQSVYVEDDEERLAKRLSSMSRKLSFMGGQFKTLTKEWYDWGVYSRLIINTKSVEKSIALTLFAIYMVMHTCTVLTGWTPSDIGLNYNAVMAAVPLVYLFWQTVLWAFMLVVGVVAYCQAYCLGRWYKVHLFWHNLRHRPWVIIVLEAIIPETYWTRMTLGLGKQLWRVLERQKFVEIRGEREWFHTPWLEKVCPAGYSFVRKSMLAGYQDSLGLDGVCANGA